MRYEVELNQLPAGFALSIPNKAGDPIDVLQSAFASDERGIWFYRFLEAFERDFLQPCLNSGPNRSGIDHFLVLISRENRASVYVNELRVICDIIPRRRSPINAGDPIYEDDIAGFTGIRFPDISIPNDHGIIYFFTHGWRRGVFFDFRPLASSAVLENLERDLAASYEYVFFNELFSEAPEAWPRLYQQGWFPFIALPKHARSQLLSRAAGGNPLQPIENGILDSFDAEALHSILDTFRNRAIMQAHLPLLEAGIDRYLAGDYISSINNIWPRVEGLLRYAFGQTGRRVSQQDLINTMRDVISSDLSAPLAFFPDQFRDYLLTYYFQHFDIASGQLDLSRHTIGHGVSRPETYDRKQAFLGILMIDQLSYYLQLAETLNSSTALSPKP